MIDIKLIREKTDYVKNALLKRGLEVDFSELLHLDEERKRLISETEALKAKRNDVSAQIPRLKKEGKEVEGLFREMKDVSERIKDFDAQLSLTKDRIKDSIDVLPNIPADEVPAGGKERNEVLRTWGEKPDFDFDALDHIDLVTSLKLVDYERGVKIGGSGFWLYTGAGARLEWGLINFFIDEHGRDGYQFILPPHLLNYECGYTAGQFPKFVDDVYQIAGNDSQGRFLLPTSETALINFHRDEVLKEEDLPLKYFSYTPCYRKEAGSYRARERGMIRGHQFNKVEMFQFTRPEDSEKAHEELSEKAERLIRQLGLHHRVSLLAAEDCTSAMAKTFDAEVWMPSMEDYIEVSSISNARDYQARRGNIRFKRTSTKKNEFIHSLNASGLATSRLIPAIVEQFQQSDGSVLVPEVLRSRVGTDRLTIEG